MSDAHAVDRDDPKRRRRLLRGAGGAGVTEAERVESIEGAVDARGARVVAVVRRRAAPIEAGGSHPDRQLVGSQQPVATVRGPAEVGGWFAGTSDRQLHVADREVRAGHDRRDRCQQCAEVVALARAGLALPSGEHGALRQEVARGDDRERTAPAAAHGRPAHRRQRVL